MLDSRPRGRGFKPHRRHCVLFLSKNINPSLVLVQPRKTGPFIPERLLMGHKESNQTNKQNKHEKITQHAVLIIKNCGNQKLMYICNFNNSHSCKYLQFFIFIYVIFNPLCTGNPKWVLLQTNEDPDEMLHKVAFIRVYTVC